MGSNLKKVVLAFILIFSVSGFAQDESEFINDFEEISTVTIDEVTTDPLGMVVEERIHTKGLKTINNPIQTASMVIAVSKDIVALGQAVYELVLKGKPVNNTKYTPISVIPKVNGEPAEDFELEGWSAPVKRTYQIKHQNKYDVTIIHFMFSVMYSYKGTFNGGGAYLTAVQVVPEFVKTLWGWELAANMKLGGIQNVGTKANPVASATILVEHTASSILATRTIVDSFFISGLGQFKHLNGK